MDFPRLFPHLNLMFPKDPPEKMDELVGRIITDHEVFRMERLKTPEYFNSTTQINNRERPDWQQTDWRLLYWSMLFLDTLERKHQIGAFVLEAFRDKETQNHYFDKGTSKAKYPYAAHCQGNAVDIIHSRFAYQLTKDEWKFFAKIGFECLKKLNSKLKKAEQLQLVWGGDWSFYDPAHWEIKNWRETVNLKIQPTEPLRLSSSPRVRLRLLNQQKGLT